MIHDPSSFSYEPSLAQPQDTILFREYFTNPAPGPKLLRLPMMAMTADANVTTA